MLPIKLNLPPDFLDEEIRCDYKISTKMKEIWAIELDLFVEFDRVCKKYGIKYMASGGTMLGAVRHKGFIPWDDDMDLMMFRSEWEKLCAVAEKEFKAPYFFQTGFTDKGFGQCWGKLRNVNTAAIEKNGALRKYQFCQGIFIDIFVLDGIPDDESLWTKQKRCIEKQKKRTAFIINFTERYSTYTIHKILLIPKTILHFFLKIFCRPKKYLKKMDDICKTFSNQKTERIGTLSFTTEKYTIKYFADYEDLVEVPFEFLYIPIGRNYEHALTVRYGDWKKMVRGESLHEGIFFDTEKSYIDYQRLK